MYASPIAYGLKYAMERVPPRFQIIYLLNPLSTPLEAFRASLLGTDWPPVRWLIYAGVCAAAMFLLGAYSFKRMERQFADVV
jgi:lipopolysaccharide transport system permease protein